MPERDGYEPGTPMWVDLGTDVEAAKTFYGGLFGWTAEDAGPPEETGGYGFFLKDGKLVAGFGPQQDPGPPFWASYVGVSDAQVTAKQVEASGGTVVVPPMEVMTAGHLAVFQDPQGAFFSIWQPGDHNGAQLVNEPGSFCWSELNTTDKDAATAFYTAVFGWGIKPSPEYSEFLVGGNSIAGMMDLQNPAVPPHWLVYFAVADVDESVAKVHELGGNVLVPKMDSPAGPFSIVQDPQGAFFGIIRL